MPTVPTLSEGPAISMTAAEDVVDYILNNLPPFKCGYVYTHGVAAHTCTCRQGCFS